MPMVLMENPKHGRHHFYSPAEVEAAKSNGWVVVAEQVPEPVKSEPEVEPKQEPEPAAKPAKKAAKKSRR